ncbi:MAG: tryptophan synthase subunit alpha [Magnetococcales bacterium]|nr:tryptophan synthase subunit alpha [Magnetococcales bacterium]
MTPTPLETHIRARLAAQKTASPILLMSHLVLGHPSLEENRRVIDAMAANGVDLMELQIPFSEPIADGPVIALANQAALDHGFRVEEGLRFIGETVRRHPEIPFLIMTYFNILLARGVERFIREAAELGARGLIIPDLPPQEADAAMAACREFGNGNLDWIQLLTPTSTDERLRFIGERAAGFCYCVARKGVTGKRTDFDAQVRQFIDRCRAAASTPLAVGFGVKWPEDVDALRGVADIAVVGTAAMEHHASGGAIAVGAFFGELSRGRRADSTA